MTPEFPVEDNYADVLRKAQRGWGVSDLEICRQASLQPRAWAALLDGRAEEAPLRAVAGVLHLRPLALLKLALSPAVPDCGVWPDGVLRITSTYQGRMGVNAWLVWDPQSKAAAVFDTGADAEALSREIVGRGLDLRGIYLTHRHGDHLGALPSLRTFHPVPVHCHHRTGARDAETFDWGHTFPLGPLSIESRQTTGHTDDGTSYYIRGLARPVAVVGDALFAGSMGGGIYRFCEALETNGRNVFSMPEATLLCPGHGPATTVGWERQHNPFAPEPARP